ncbi:MAG: YjcQ family protein [Clostridiales bacterium]|nr:YjcQ family protein [Clostridiales bacterium]
MSKNDYFVIAYRILTYLYSCFMAGEKPDTEMFGPEALRINNGYWVNTMESLSNEGYITGIVFTEPLGGTRNAKIIDLKITEKGITFLHENSLIAKAKRTLKDVKDIIPGA